MPAVARNVDTYCYLLQMPLQIGLVGGVRTFNVGKEICVTVHRMYTQIFGILSGLYSA